MSKRRVLYMRLICRRMVLYCYLSAAGRRQAFLPLRLTAAGAGASLRPVRGAWSSLRRIYKYDKDHSGGAALPYLITYPRSGVGATALDGGADVRRGGGGMRKWRWIRCHDHIYMIWRVELPPWTHAEVGQGYPDPDPGRPRWSWASGSSPMLLGAAIVCRSRSPA
jgi:hypothetical protein